MKIKNIKLTREEKQIIHGAKLLSVSVNGGNIIASVEDGDGEIELNIVVAEAPANTVYFSTLNEGHMISHVFVTTNKIEANKENNE